MDLVAVAGGVVVEGLVKEFRRHDQKGFLTAVNNVSYSFPDGQLTTMLGPSGCGKTTVLRMIAGFETPTGGRITMAGREITAVPAHLRDIAMVFQNYALFPHLSIFENIAYGLRVKKLAGEEVRERVMRVVRLMQLTGMEHRYPNQVSGGQQQRVALARAIVIEPKLLLFDEPLSNLDAKLREYMRDEIRKLQLRLGVTSIYVTHDQAEAMAISDRIVIMNNGAIEQVGPPSEIYHRPVNRFVANFMGKANFIDCLVETAGDGWATVRVGEARVKVRAERAAAGQSRTLVIRPESLALTATGGTLPATVKQAVFLGATVEYAVQTGPHELTVQVINPRATGVYEAGAAVGLLLDPDCTYLLPETGGMDEIQADCG